MKKITLFILTIMAIATNAFAKKEKFVSSTINGATLNNPSVTHWGINKTLTAEVVGFTFNSSTYKTKEVKSYIQLRLKTENIPNLTAFRAKVPVKITYFLNNSSFATPIVENKTLTVEFDPTEGVKYKNIDLLLIPNAYKVQVEYSANSITLETLSGTNTPISITNDHRNFIELQAFTEIERYYNFNNIYQTGVGSVEQVIEHIQINFQNANNELTLNWDALPYAEGYELEYTFVDDYSDDIANYLPASQLRFSFKNNSTRILLEKNEYTMPLVQEHGYLVFRVRGYGMAGSNFDRIYFGNFDLDAGGGFPANHIFTVGSFPHKYKIDAQTHTTDKINWQSVTTFAEEGKSKTVAKYMDGTMRERQIVTSISTDHNAIVAETIYDRHGRPAVNILPAPVDLPAIKYYANFNQNQAGQPYSHLDFDIKGADVCSPAIINPLKRPNNQGAGNYYSKNNDIKNGYNAYIPEAYGYPFSTVKYMPDNTTRVVRQGGVGEIFQPGKTTNGIQNHDTKFYYGKPTQERLDRLFGTDVGYREHYQMNMVVDANGQAAVSYVDLDGKTIASALAGKNPESLDRLDSYHSDVVTTNLLDNSAAPAFGEGMLLASESFLVPDDNTVHQFRYELSPRTYDALSCNGANYCLDCIYDIEIKVINDECGIALKDTAFTVGTLTNLNTLCNDANASSAFNFSLNLNRGSYTVSRRLVVNQQAAITYANAILNDPNNVCLETYQDFLNDEIANLDSTRCMNACEACEAEATQITQAAALAQARQACDSLWCKPQMPTLCDVARISMINDLYPGGQYAQYLNNNGDVSLTVSPISIFNTTDFNTTVKRINFAGLQNIQVTILGETHPLSYYTSDTTRLRHLIANWPDGLAEELLPLHPEYCYLDFCNTMTSSNEFDTKLVTTLTFQEAQQAGLLNDINLFFNQDAFYTTVLQGTLKQQFAAKFSQFSNGKSIQYIAVFMSNCPSGTDINVCNGAWGDGINDNEEWEMFRGLYFSLKQEFIQKAREAYVRQRCDCQLNNTIGCATRNCGIDIIGAIGLPNSACSTRPIADPALYKDAAVRFPTINDVQFPNADSLTTSIYDLTPEQQRDFMNVDDPQNGLICPTCPEMEAFKIMVYYLNYKGWTTQNTTVRADNIAGMDSVIRTRLWGSDDNKEVRISPFANSGIEIKTEKCNLTMKPDTAVDWSKPIFPTCLEIIDYKTAKLHIIVNGAYKTILNINASCELFYCEGRPAQDSLVNACTCDKEYSYTQRYQLGDIVNYKGVCYIAQFTGAEFVPIGKYPDFKEFWTPLCEQTTVCQNPFNLNFETTGGYVSTVNHIVANQWSPAGVAQGFVLPSRGFIADALANTQTIISKTATVQPNTNYRLSFDYGVWNTAAQSTIGTMTFQVLVNGQVLGTVTPTVAQLRIIQHRMFDWNSGNATQAVVTLVKTDNSVRRLFSLDNLQMICGKQDDNGRKPTSGKDSTVVRYIPANVCGCNALCDMPLPSPSLAYTPCDSLMAAIARDRAARRYEQYRDSVFHALLNGYTAHCLQAAEAFTMQYEIAEYHFTLYYYDQSGNLVRTVPPAGVMPLPNTQLAAVQTARNNRNRLVPSHVLTTTYRHNALNGVVWQTTPDAGVSEFFYDRLGRIVLSQNAKQRPERTAAYTRYDRLGRNIEVGKTDIRSIGDLKRIAFNYQSFETFITQPTSERSEITHTFYDRPASQAIAAAMGGQPNLRNRIGTVAYFATNITQNTFDYDHATHYRYDIGGNVSDILQDFGKNSPFGAGNIRNQSKHIAYRFDLVSGKVNEVHYQSGYPDQFIHRNTYDADNRLTAVHTSTEGIVWENDARYKYYRHGPLARTELGTDRVQGIDHVYNLQGWIKGVNGFAATPAQDAGRDGIAPSPQGPISGSEQGYQTANRPTAPDVYSYWLSYYQNDYQAIGDAPAIGQPLQPLTSGNYHSTPAQLYNGNIRSMYTYLKPKGGMGMHYRYDQLNRIKTQNAWDFAGTTATPSPYDAYLMALTYDANGNIQSLLRNGNTTVPQMDDLKYVYYNTDGSTYIGNPSSAQATNRLAQIKDDVLNSNYTHDLDNQLTNNYTYDAIGNLTADASEGIQIDWNLQNKVSQVRKANGTRITYAYDALGNRVEKQLAPPSGGQTGLAGGASFYIRDAQGNTLAVYEKTADNKLIWAEQHLYGSGRLGMYRPQKETPPIPAIASLPSGLLSRDDTRGVVLPYTHTRNTTQYELTNHLGNVLVTISDSKVAPPTGVGGLGASVLTTTDYYAFGMEIKERSYAIPPIGGQGGLFRYGYNGKENDHDWGTGLIQDYGFRLYNPAVARFLSVDPITKDYPELTPYQFASNTPINSIDLDGLERKIQNSCHNGKQFDFSLSMFGLKENQSYSKKWTSSQVNVSTIEKTFFQLMGGSYKNTIPTFGPTIPSFIQSVSEFSSETKVGKAFKFNGKNYIEMEQTQTETILYFDDNNKNFNFERIKKIEKKTVTQTSYIEVKKVGNDFVFNSNDITMGEEIKTVKNLSIDENFEKNLTYFNLKETRESLMEAYTNNKNYMNNVINTVNGQLSNGVNSAVNSVK
jgi:RHS repeat-associated protein